MYNIRRIAIGIAMVVVLGVVRSHSPSPSAEWRSLASDEIGPADRIEGFSMSDGSSDEVLVARVEAVPEPPGDEAHADDPEQGISLDTEAATAWREEGEGRFAYKGFEANAEGLKITLPETGEWMRYAFETLSVGGIASGTRHVVPQGQDGIVEYWRGSLRERYLPSGGMVEQVFEIPAVPNAGDLVVRGRLTHSTGQTATVRPDGTTQIGSFGIGRAVAIDAHGEQVDAPVTCRGDVIEVTVPAEWLARAAMPLTVDPLFGSGASISSNPSDVARINLGEGYSVAPVLHVDGRSDPTYASVQSHANEWRITVKDGPLVIATIVLRKVPHALGSVYEATIIARIAGVYRYGFSVRGDLVQALNGERTQYRNPGTTVTHYYPYDPLRVRATSQAKFAEVDLAMPGVLANGTYYILDSAERTLVQIRPMGGSTDAYMPVTRSVNRGMGDQIRTGFALEPSDRRSFRLIAAATPRHAQSIKFGVPRGTNERMAQIPFTPFIDYRNDSINLTAQQYRTWAKELKRGGYHAAIIRTLEPHGWIAKIFHEEGIRAYQYQFWGAVRHVPGTGNTVPTGKELPPDVDSDWVLYSTTSGSAGYTAPRPDGNWALLDVRHPDVRAYFVEKARRLVGDGATDERWDGLFLDGPAFWADAEGHVGGKPSALRGGDPISWAAARAKLLEEMRDAIHLANPHARLGVLASVEGHYDHLHLADYVILEFVNGRWGEHGDARNPYERDTVHRPSWSGRAERAKMYVGTSLIPGSKSGNPLLNGSALSWAGNRIDERWYYDFGSFHRPYNDDHARITGDAGRFRSATEIVSVEPRNSEIVARGVSRIRASRDATLTFNHPVAVLNVGTGKPLSAAQVRLMGGIDYIIAERTGDGWQWTREGFAFENNQTYLSGDFRMDHAPDIDGRDLVLRGDFFGDRKVVLHCVADPGISAFADGAIVQEFSMVPDKQTTGRRPRTITMTIPRGTNKLVVRNMY